MYAARVICGPVLWEKIQLTLDREEAAMDISVCER